MGQYHKVVNLDKQEYLNPHQFGDGLKLMEFGSSAQGTLSALAGMIAFDAQQQGPWAGCRLTVTGDYGDEGRFVPPEFAEHNLYTLLCGLDEEDELSPPVYAELKDECIRQLKGLGIPLSFSKFGETDLEALRDTARSFAQPEDLFEALDVRTREDLERTLSDCLTMVRCSRQANQLSWMSVVDVQLVLGKDATVSRMDVAFRSDHRSEDFPASQTRSLGFPASTADVRQFFMIADSTPLLNAG